jgi:phage terminase large subunit GpA-like protein
MRSTRSIVFLALAAAVAAPPAVAPSAWSAEHIVQPDGDRAGQTWSAELTPYLVEILDRQGPDDPGSMTAVRKSSQVGFTAVGQNWILSIPELDPGNAMVLMPTFKAVQDFERDKLGATIAASPKLKGLIAGQRSRSERGSTSLRKVFPGGSIVLTGANSAADLRSRTVRHLLADEVDEYDADLEGQGDPLLLAFKRQSGYEASGNFKRLVGSTPTIQGESRIDRFFENGDRRLWHVPCPHCGHEQPLVWENLRYSETWPHNAAYECADCHALIEHADKRAMVAQGRWVATNPEGRYYSYHLDCLISPFTTWDILVEEFVAAGNDEAALKVFENTRLGRSYQVKGEAPKTDALRVRALSLESHGPALTSAVPAAALFLTAGCDVQADRLEISLWGFGVGKTRWQLDHIVLDGDTNDLPVWAKLAELLARDFPTDVEGQVRRIELTAIDSGYRAERVYDFARGRHNVVVVKGSSTRMGFPIGRPKRIGYTPKGTQDKRTVQVWQVDTHMLKSEIFGALQLDWTPSAETPSAPTGFVHLPTATSGHDLSEALDQLTAEVLVQIPQRNGLVKHEFRKVRQRNEALDCAVYALSAAYHPTINMASLTPDRWAALAAERGAPVEADQLDLLRSVTGGAPRAAKSARRSGAKLAKLNR